MWDVDVVVDAVVGVVAAAAAAVVVVVVVVVVVFAINLIFTIAIGDCNRCSS